MRRRRLPVPGRRMAADDRELIESRTPVRGGGAVKSGAGLSELLDLSRQMLVKAEAGAWDDLPELESRRGAILARYFETLRAAGPGTEDVAGIHVLREINDRIIQLGKIQSQRLVQALSDSSYQRRAAACYRQSSAG